MIINILVVIFALLVGSFLNVVIHRLPRGESVVWPGSHCVTCGHRLGILELIPVLSYLWLQGKCRYCSEKIALRYPLVEIFTAVLFLLIYLQWGLSLKTAAGWVLTAILVICAFIDIDEGIIPDSITYPGIILAFILSYFTTGLVSAFTGALLFGGILFLAGLLTNGGMGGGDVKLAVLIGAFTGLQESVLAFILSSLLGGVWAAGLLLTKKADRKTAVKFGPFLALGGWLAYTFGPDIITFYFSLFN